LNTALKYELVKKSGASISYDSVKMGQGFDAAKNYLKENSKVREDLVKKVRSAMSQRE
jgi:recombination protein RecA